MTDITQADRDAADQIMEAVDACGCKLCSTRVCEAFARHRMEERAAIVAWLRDQGITEDENKSQNGWWDTSTGALYGASILEAIEQGRHLK